MLSDILKYLKNEFAVCSANNFLSFGECWTSYLALGWIIFCIILAYKELFKKKDGGLINIDKVPKILSSYGAILDKFKVTDLYVNDGSRSVVNEKEMPYEKDEIKKALIMHAGTLILTDKKNLEGEEKNKHLERRELVLNMFKNLSMFQKHETIIPLYPDKPEHSEILHKVTAEEKVLEAEFIDTEKKIEHIKNK